jgi:uncharacterized protein involved in cysteine biosynthesis
MGNLLAAIGAVMLAIKDVLTPRLFFLALICFIAVGALAFGAAWAAIEFGAPLIPDGEGWVRYLTRTLEIAAGLGAGLLVIVFAPVVALFVSGLLFDVAAAKVERAIGAPKARDVPLHEGLWNGLRVAVPALFLNLFALVFLLIPVLYPIVFVVLNGHLFGREFFTQAAVRHMSFQEARDVRRRAPLSVFIVGLACSIVPFIAPLIGASAMARLNFVLTRPAGSNSNSDN